MGYWRARRDSNLGKGGWRVIDSTGQWIAAGFTSQAYALRWIDGFNLMRTGSQLSDDDLKWIYLHWYPARPVRLDPETRAPTEYSDLAVLVKNVKEGLRPADTSAINLRSREPLDLVT